MRDRCVQFCACACIAGAVIGGGCVKVTTVNIGTKSSLERQLVGELEPLSEEETLAASVRAQGQIGLGSHDDLQSAAIAARRRQLFNRDEIDETKKLGCLGEGVEALLVARPCSGGAGFDQSRVERLLREENEDRTAIIDWALASDPVLTPSERPRVVQIYRQLLTERLRPGDFLQRDDGTWAQR